MRSAHGPKVIVHFRELVCFHHEVFEVLNLFIDKSAKIFMVKLVTFKDVSSSVFQFFENKVYNKAFE